jgi:hypothetical protein
VSSLSNFGRCNSASATVKYQGYAVRTLSARSSIFSCGGRSRFESLRRGGASRSQSPRLSRRSLPRRSDPRRSRSRWELSAWSRCESRRSRVSRSRSRLRSRSSRAGSLRRRPDAEPPSSEASRRRSFCRSTPFVVERLVLGEVLHGGHSLDNHQSKHRLRRRKSHLFVRRVGRDLGDLLERIAEIVLQVPLAALMPALLLILLLESIVVHLLSHEPQHTH